MPEKEGVTSNAPSPDITERKQAEEALKESEEELQTYLESAPDGVYVNDLKGTFLYGNKKAEELTGYERQELIGRSFLKLNLLPTEYLVKAGKLLALNAMRRPTGPDEFELTRKDGSRVWVEINTTPIKQGGKVVVIGFVRDITERKQAEEELRRQREQTEGYLNIAGVMLAVVNADENITLINKRGCEILGYKEGELIGKNWFDILVPQRMGGEVRSVFRKLMAGDIEPVEYYENPLLTKDGEERLIAFHNTVIGTPSGQIVGTLFSGEDITKRKQMEQELRKRNEQLDAQNEELQAQSEELMTQQQELIERTSEVERANQLKSEFLAQMSHDLRTPLNVIIGFSELMRDEVPGKVNEEQRHCLDDILSSSKHLLDLINDVLDLSKIESGKMKLKLTNIALSDVIELLRSTVVPILAPRKQSLDVEIEEGLPQVHADKSKVREVLFNLLSNATKSTPDSGKLRVKAVRDGDWCQVSVIDNGIGIKKEDQERIFEPFYQLDNPLTTERRGTGLGLTLVKQIIELHGGQIWVDSEYGRGSRFTFTLPLATD